MGGVSAAGAIEDFVSIGNHGGKTVLGLIYVEIQDFARFTGAIGIFAVDIAYVILVDQVFAIGIDECGNAYILWLKIEDHLGRPCLGNPDGTPGKEGFPAHGYSNRNIRQFPPDRRTHCGRPAPMFPEMPPVFSLEKIFQGA